MIPLVGFLPADDPRVRRHGRGDRAGADSSTASCSATRPSPASTACRRARARSSPARSGWSTTWRCSGRRDEARRLFERLLALRNDVGLLAEEYDPAPRRQLGNFPQAFSHVALVNTACNLSQAGRPARLRADA